MIHIAVLLKPYLDLVLRGRKTVECRLTVQRRDPFQNIEAGERIYFKMSAGPYAATAVADHVIFDQALTPQRIARIRRDYNELICGDAAYWNAKRTARHCTLIWLRDVQPTAVGPSIRPLQGVAWLTLDDEPAWRRVERSGQADLVQVPAGGAFMVQVTPGNLRNNSLYVSSVIHRFPSWAMGGARKIEAARPMTLMLHEGPTVQTDIVAPRKLLRTRVWGGWFRKHGVKRGDHVVFSPVDDATYCVGLARRGGSVVSTA